MGGDKTRDKINDLNTTLMIAFGLENVINLPKAEVSSFFY